VSDPSETDTTDDGVDRTQLRPGTYFSYFEVGSDFWTFYVDCGQVGHRDQPNRLYHQIITSPVVAHRLLKTLGKGLSLYRSRFGVIRDESGAPVRGDEE